MTHCCTIEAKLKSLPPIETTTIFTLCVAAKLCSIFACPCRPAPLSAKSRPGLKLPLPSVYVVVLAPLQARFRPLTPPPM